MAVIFTGDDKRRFFWRVMAWDHAFCSVFKTGLFLKRDAGSFPLQATAFSAVFP
ncbi:hypothetical protein HY3_10090 [Hyphomonas pacifica]|uniref:Uncharacterized protein n=1 Tax=Hyphomonas pacifica TaxID=1280941 RepID=A0A062TVN8_9PROT|nr:hypothetical protein HY2_10200 [Hyphomonas pacifica]RAN34650.1 hypothetical protein HY3_10090 [Hyphomonas pacifica]RAN36203.1 hypothetical protein HY11_12315 [Hyphomonas pacifica]